MKREKIIKIFILFLLIFISLILLYNKIINDKKKNEIKISDPDEERSMSSNIIEDVRYVSKDAKGNEYIIEAVRGEIDYLMPSIIYLEKVKGLIKLNNSNNINISSNYGKYNLANYDTIFSKNVIINYLDNKVTGEYLDFSLERNSMTITRDVIYSNIDNVLKADVIEMNIETKDTKIFMFEENKNVNIKSKN